VYEPVERDASLHETALESAQQCAISVHGHGVVARLEGESGERSRGLADVPFHGMKAIAAVRDVSRREVLRTGDQVAHVERHERAQWDLEGPCATRHTDIVRPRPMDVDGIPAHADRVGEHLGAGSGLIFGRDLVLAYGAEATQPAALADVGILAEPVDGVE